MYIGYLRCAKEYVKPNNTKILDISRYGENYIFA
jgi:hypothetical protein